MSGMQRLKTELEDRRAELSLEIENLQRMVRDTNARIAVVDAALTQVCFVIGRLNEIEEDETAATEKPGPAPGPKRRDVRGEVLIYIRANSPCSQERIAEALGIPMRGVGKALSYWTKKEQIDPAEPGLYRARLVTIIPPKRDREIIVGADGKGPLDHHYRPAEAGGTQMDEETAARLLRDHLEDDRGMTLQQLVSRGIPKYAIERAHETGILVMTEEGGWRNYKLAPAGEPAAAAE